MARVDGRFRHTEWPTVWCRAACANGPWQTNAVPAIPRTVEECLAADKGSRDDCDTDHSPPDRAPRGAIPNAAARATPPPAWDAGRGEPQTGLAERPSAAYRGLGDGLSWASATRHGRKMPIRRSAIPGACRLARALCRERWHGRSQLCPCSLVPVLSPAPGNANRLIGMGCLCGRADVRTARRRDSALDYPPGQSRGTVWSLAAWHPAHCLPLP